MYTDYNEILHKVENIDPISYGRTRNYIDGAVTRLSPYISRGVISTKFVLNSVLERGFHPKKIEKFIQELAWRDYWQQVWVSKGEEINSDLKHEQPDVNNYQMPRAIAEARTGIDAIDKAIEEFYETGYIHNHVRMYIASLACNVGKSHWKIPARWMYYSLLDGDWASNALSWQWVAGSNSNKKYFANQENINRFCYTRQNNTFLDVEYSAFYNMDIPHELKETFTPELITPLPGKKSLHIDSSLPTVIYNFYNLDPLWKKEEKANRILLLEPSQFNHYPVSKKSVDFMMSLSKNIEDVQVYTGEFDELVSEYKLDNVNFKEHPLSRHYKGTEVSRDWMFSTRGYFKSFFAFWKKCEKELYK